MEWAATDSVEVEYVATPLASRFTGPNESEPSLKVTEPLGVPPGPDTVALNVTDWPKVEGFGAAFTVVVLPAFWTSWENAEDVEPSKLPSPL
jgi:hypothetical protein